MRIGASDARRLHRHALRAGDIVFSRRGDVGRRSLVRHAQSGWICGTGCLLARFGGNRADVNPAYVAEYIGSSSAQAWLFDNAVGGTMPNLNTSILSSLPIVLPPKRVQDRVVSALGDARQLIASLERLIAKKEAIKSGMTHQLLAGVTRLPGFTAEWTECDLGELGSFLKGRGVTRDDVRSTGVPCIRYGEIYTEFGDYTTNTRSYVSREISATALPVRAGDILFAGSGETKAEIGTALAYIGEKDAVAGGDIIVLRGAGYNSVFLASLLNSPRVAAQKARRGQGDAVVHISSAALSGLKIQLPDRDEQDAIAAVIQDADREIVALHKRLEKARSIKQGVMQELLTGKTRLEVKEVE
nr:restriction endonuclease subunit S [Microbacterium sorbitolivorans]